MIETPWMTVAQAAKYAGVGIDRIHQWIDAKQLRPSNLTGERKGSRGRIDYRIHRDDVDAVLRSLRVAEAEAPEPETPKRRKGATTSPGANAIKGRFRPLKA